MASSVNEIDDSSFLNLSGSNAFLSDKSFDPMDTALSNLMQAASDFDKVTQAEKNFKAAKSSSFPMKIEQRMTEIDPLCTQRQRSMMWYFETFGVSGLVHYVSKIAQAEASLETDIANNASFFNEPSTISLPEKLGPLFGPGILKKANEISKMENLIEDIQYDSSIQCDVATSAVEQHPSSADTEERANSKKGPHASWNSILADIKNGSPILQYYISSLHPSLIEALITGTLPSKMEEEGFRNRVGHWTTLRDCQGTYVVYMALTRHSADLQNTAHSNQAVGKGLSLRKLRQVYEDMRLYIDTKNQCSEALARLIDSARSGARKLRNELSYSSARRYGSGTCHNVFIHHEKWLDFIEIHYIRWIQQRIRAGDHSILQQRLSRCFCYVGLSENVQGRAPNHWKHSSNSSPVLGLLAAALEYRYPNQFTVSDYTYQVLRTVEPAHIGIDEKITTLLASAYAWDGGLSAAMAGISRGGGASLEDTTRSERFAYSRAVIESSDVQARNKEKSKRLHEEVRNRFQLILECNKVETDIQNELKELISAALQNVKMALSEFDAMTELMHCTSDDGSAGEFDPVSDLLSLLKQAAELDS